MSKRSIRVPDDVAELAELVVEASKDADFDDEGLSKAVSYAIMADRLRRGEGSKPAHPSPSTDPRVLSRRARARRRYWRLKEDDPEALREIRERNYLSLRHDPVRYRRKLDRWAARQKELRKANPEAYKERGRRAREREKLKNPEKVKAAKRARDQARRERDPEAYRQQQLKYARRKWAKLNVARIVEAISTAIPTTYPAHVRNDVLQATTLPILDGAIDVKEIPAEVRRQISAYWRARTEYHLASFDAPLSVGDGRTLHDVTPG